MTHDHLGPHHGHADKIAVTTVFERVAHWLLAISCLLLLFTGLGLLFQSWTLFAVIFGGAQKLKVIHDVVAWVFAIAIPLALVSWGKDCLFLDEDDMKWLKRAGGYLERGAVHFNMGKFNPGQKGAFVAIILFGILMVLTGLGLMFPDSVSRGLVQWAGALHVFGAMVMGVIVVVHIYLGTIGNPGSVPAILGGWVTREWANTHRPKWMAQHPNGL
jgi:formate dehydrogenase subunit gamma